MIDVHDRRADVQFGEVANDLIGIDRTRVAAHVDVGARAEHLRFGDQREVVGHRAAFDRRDVSANANAAAAKCREVGDVGPDATRRAPRNSPNTSRRPADSAQNRTGTRRRANECGEALARMMRAMIH